MRSGIRVIANGSQSYRDFVSSMTMKSPIEFAEYVMDKPGATLTRPIDSLRWMVNFVLLHQVGQHLLLPRIEETTNR